ncbi:NAD-dependent epimerase/dehydratase family protein [Candidatus Kuenenbacteria bacterium]|nr:NAD-dependent epimerase/dehydratase family protein [Candidatus Kuenenbacteria bacterium]
MTILVTGGAGFIGSHLVDKLIKEKHRVIVVDDLSTGKKINLNKRAKFYRLDIQDKKLEQIFKKEKPQVVYHLAAQMNVRKSIADPIFDAKTNIVGVLNLLENCVKYHVKKFVFISTGGAIYGDGVKIPTPETATEAPISPYGIAKLATEKYLHYYRHQYGLNYTVLRLANIYGPRQNYLGEAGVVAIFCHQLKNNQPTFINGPGQQTRDFVFVADVVAAALKALKDKKPNIYNIATSKENNINQLASALQKVSGVKTPIEHRSAIKGEQMRSCLNYQKIKKHLGWSPKYDLEKGLRETWQWFQKN